jgi:hypothetical protein
LWCFLFALFLFWSFGSTLFPAKGVILRLSPEIVLHAALCSILIVMFHTTAALYIHGRDPRLINKHPSRLKISLKIIMRLTEQLAHNAAFIGHFSPG